LTEETCGPGTVTADQEWSNPDGVKASDNNYAAITSPYFPGPWERFLYGSNYGFNLPSNAIVDKVEIGMEMYVTQRPYDTLGIAYWKPGVGWVEPMQHQSWDSEGLYFWDITANESWTPAWINAIETCLHFYFGGGGCYPINTIMMMYDSVLQRYLLKNPEEVQVGDLALAWQEGLGFFHTRITGIQKHTGIWRLLDLYSGESEYVLDNGSRVSWKKHLCVTENHPIYAPYAQKRIMARDFKVGDALAHLDKGKLILQTITEIKATKEYVGTVYSYTKEHTEAHLFMKSLTDQELSILNAADAASRWKIVGDFNAIVMDTKEGTAYVDWIPMRVTHHTPTGPNPRRKSLGVGR
jgi:hypothetical protein